MSVIQKIFVIIMNKRLMKWLEANGKLSDAQGAFQKTRGAEEFFLGFDMLLHQSLRKGSGMVYVGQLDLEKAFDRVNRTILWNTIWDMGIKGRFWRLLQTVYKDTYITVNFGIMQTEPIKLTQGVRQGCSLSSTLFAIYVDKIIKMLADTGAG